jgi:hypothetical protein
MLSVMPTPYRLMPLTPAGIQRFACDLDGLVDIIHGVRCGDEDSFELAARQIHTAGEHLPEEAGEELGVAATGVVIIADRALMEEKSEHTANALDDVWDPGISGGAVEPIGQSG